MSLFSALGASLRSEIKTLVTNSDFCLHFWKLTLVFRKPRSSGLFLVPWYLFSSQVNFVVIFGCGLIELGRFIRRHVVVVVCGLHDVPRPVGLCNKQIKKQADDPPVRRARSTNRWSFTFRWRSLYGPIKSILPGIGGAAPIVHARDNNWFSSGRRANWCRRARQMPSSAKLDQARPGGRPWAGHYVAERNEKNGNRRRWGKCLLYCARTAWPTDARRRASRGRRRDGRRRVELTR